MKLILAHLLLLLRGCRHPRFEEDVLIVEEDEVFQTFVVSTCTVCGLTLVNPSGD